MLYEDDLLGSEIVFLLDIDYQGITYRFSTFPIEIYDPTTSQNISYTGQMADPQITQETSFQGFQVGADSVAMELIFPQLDWIEEWRNGRLLDQSRCEISMVTVLNGATKFTTLDRVGLFSGRVIEAIFGDPNRPIGHISFSIENSLNVRTEKVLQDRNILKSSEFKLDVIQSSEGKIVPMVFGKPGPFYVGGDDEITRYDYIPSTPLYWFNVDAGLGWVEAIIAYHPIESEFIRVYDNDDGNFVNPVELGVDSNGYSYSYIRFYTGGGNVEDNSFSFATAMTDEIWAQWSEYDGGGIPNPFSDGVLEGAGDICRFFLDMAGLDYDASAWVAATDFLNQYKLAGYINSMDVNAYDFLREEIFPLLPIEVINGPKGIKPIINLYFASSNLMPQHTIEESGEFQAITAIQPLDMEISNKIIFRYAWEGRLKRLKANITIDPTIRDSQQLSNRYKLPLSTISYQRYGLREKTIETQYVYDFQTAQRIISDKLRMNALGAYGLEIQAAAKYGYIQVGDIISFSYGDHIKNHKCQVISKTWQDYGWRLILHIEDNPIINPRP
jgi:hypothetical protein